MSPDARAKYQVTGLADRPRMAAASRAATLRALPAIAATAKPPAGSGRLAILPAVGDGTDIGEILVHRFDVSVSVDQDSHSGAEQLGEAGFCRRDHQRLGGNLCRRDIRGKRGERADVVH